jgi:hypothetical protein
MKKKKNLNEADLGDKSYNSETGTHSSIEKNEEEVTEIFSEEIKTSIDDRIEEPILNEASVRRLSLFDNISSNISEVSIEENIKTEPIISENNNNLEESEKMETFEKNAEDESEFNASDDHQEEEFNQETEEELLDIPTFLRRQAN